MKEKLEFESCELKGFVKNEPTTSAEFNTLAKEAGSTKDDPCCDMATDYALFHRVLSSWRSDLMAAVIAATGIAAVTKDNPKGDKDAQGKVIQVVDEKPAVYVARVKAQLAKDGKDVTILQQIADAVSNGVAEGSEPKWFKNAKLVFKDYPGYQFKDFIGVKETGPKAPPKTYVEKATQYIQQGADKLRITLGRIAAPIGRPPLEVVVDKATKAIVKPTPEDIAWELQDMFRAQAKAAEDKLMA